MAARRQATLYLPETSRDAIDAIRYRFNPMQARLIRAHVTLCREDEVKDWDEVEKRLADTHRFAVDLTFNELVRDGNLVFVAASDATPAFQDLRNSLLSTRFLQPRHHRPHVTLIHPRNATCDDQTFVELEDLFKPFSVIFDRVTIIEQIDGGPWRDIIDFPK